MAIDNNADFTPSIPDSGVVPTKIPYNPTGSFKFWAQKVIPLVYDDSLSYYEVLCKVVAYLNNVIQNVDNLNDSLDSTNESFETLKGYVNTTKDTLINTYNELQNYVNTYFDNLDVQEEINEKLDAMADSGELTTLLAPFIPDLVTQWLNNHVTPTSPIIDATLSISGAGADAKVTGDKFIDLDVFTKNVGYSVADFKGEPITETTVHSGKYIRYVNGEWEEISNQYWSVYEYSVEEEALYRVTGSIAQYIPLAIFANSSNTYINSTEIPLDNIGSYQRTTQIIGTPEGCTKILVNQLVGETAISAICESITTKPKTVENTSALNIRDLLLWEEGGITNGQNTPSDVRIRTTRIYMFDYPIVIPVNDQVTLGIWTYDNYSAQNPVWGGWVSDALNSYIIPQGTYFRLLTLDGGIAKKDQIRMYNRDLITLNAYDYKLPIKWRHANIGNSGEMYFTLNALTSDLLIPTIICDYAVKYISASNVKLCYYENVNGIPTYSHYVSLPTNRATVIDKNYPFVAIVVFVDWSTQLEIADAETYVTLHYLPTEEKQVNNMYLYDIIRNANSLNDRFIWSICHQGYSDSGLGHNLRGGYARAASRGFTHGECDIKLTSDNQLVCSHDPSFVDSVTGETIVIADHTLAELQEHSYFGDVISTLADIISECKRSGIGLFIDHVDDNNASYAVSTVKQLNALSICYFMSGSVQTLSNIITIDNNAKIIYLTQLSTVVADVLPSLVSLNHDLIYNAGQYVPEELANVQEIAEALPGNIRLMLWTIDNYKQIADVIPYINGWTSNAFSGRDMFNPSHNMGLDI